MTAFGVGCMRSGVRDDGVWSRLQAEWSTLPINTHAHLRHPENAQRYSGSMLDNTIVLAAAWAKDSARSGTLYSEASRYTAMGMTTFQIQALNARPEPWARQRISLRWPETADHCREIPEA